MKKLFTLFVALEIFLAEFSFAQNTFPSSGAAGIGTTTPNSSSLLDITSTTKGVLVPRMTKTQRDAITSPAQGLLIFQTNSTPGFYYYSGTAWTAVSSKGANTSLSNLVSPTGVNQHLFPNASGTLDLGSSPLRWRDVYLTTLKFPDATIQTTAFTPYTSGTGISIAGNTITNAAPDKTIVLNNGAGISISGTYPNFTVASTISQGANKSLSNLSSPTAVNTDFLPGSDNTVNLGSANNSWKDEYLDGSLYLGGARYLSYSLGTGTGNTAIGSLTLNSNTSGYSNTATGFNALYNNTTGAQNTASGYHSLYSNTTGTVNTAYGVSALYANTSGYWNIAIGGNSLFSNTTANGNVGIGYNSLYSNTTGYSNIAIGIDALRNNSIGSNEVAIGDSALFTESGNSFSNNNTALGSKTLYSNTAGYYNTAAGGGALYSNTSGAGNTAIGAEALYTNTIGIWNTAIGDYALYYNTTGYNNNATGYGALYNNTTGYQNSANGLEALFSNTTGDDNVANGLSALYSNTTGYYNTANGTYSLYANTTGDGNTANGEGSLNANTTGNYNTANGWEALSVNTIGYYNTANGLQALSANTSGVQNTADGGEAGSNVTTGTDNTFLGYSANSGSVGAGSNMTAIGEAATVTASNHIVIGNSSVTSIGGFVNWSNLSDGRVKKNIKQNVPGLAFINKLQPITYNLDLDAADKIIDRPATKDKDGKVVQSSQVELDARKAKEQIVYTGFAAQDVEKVAKGLNFDFSGVDKPDNENTLYGLRYSDFVVPLVKAVQELSAKNDTKDSTIASLQDDNATLHQQLDQLTTKMNQFESALSQCCASYPSSSKSPTQDAGNNSDQARLEQNTPNPFSQNTIIQFYIPSSASDAMIVVSDLSGKIIQRFNNLSVGNGTVILTAGTLASGTYQYSLFVNGKVIDTRQMVLTK